MDELLKELHVDESKQRLNELYNKNIQITPLQINSYYNGCFVNLLGTILTYEEVEDYKQNNIHKLFLIADGKLVHYDGSELKCWESMEYFLCNAIEQTDNEDESLTYDEMFNKYL